MWFRWVYHIISLLEIQRDLPLRKLKQKNKQQNVFRSRSITKIWKYSWPMSNMGFNCVCPLVWFSTTQSMVGWIHGCGMSDTKDQLWDLSFLPFWYPHRSWNQFPIDTEGWLFFFQFQSKNDHLKVIGSLVMTNLQSSTSFNLLLSWISFPRVLFLPEGFSHGFL